MPFRILPISSQEITELFQKTPFCRNLQNCVYQKNARTLEAENWGYNAYFSLEGEGDIVVWDCYGWAAGEVEVVVQPPGGKSQETPHPSAKWAQEGSERWRIKTTIVILRTILKRQVSCLASPVSAVLLSFCPDQLVLLCWSLIAAAELQRTWQNCGYCPTPVSSGPCRHTSMT